MNLSYKRLNTRLIMIKESKIVPFSANTSKRPKISFAIRARGSGGPSLVSMDIT